VAKLLFLRLVSLVFLDGLEFWFNGFGFGHVCISGKKKWTHFSSWPILFFF